MNWYDIDGRESYTDPVGNRREIFLVVKVEGADAWNVFCDGRQIAQSPDLAAGKSVCEDRVTGNNQQYRNNGL